jgi:hypothetical protein
MRYKRGLPARVAPGRPAAPVGRPEVDLRPAQADPIVTQPASPAPVSRRRVRRWPLFVIASPAMVAIWSGWVSLAEMCGFGLVEPFPGIAAWRLNTAITLPVGVEAYGAYAMSAWLSPATPRNARSFAKWSALGSLTLGMLGQVGYHLLAAAHRAHAPWPVVAAVACLPVITLGFGAALAHLLHSAGPEPGAGAITPGAPAPQTLPGSAVRPAAPLALPAGLVAEARALDARHRHANRGKPISRDKLKAALGIATTTASTLTRIIRAEPDGPATAAPDETIEQDDQPATAGLPPLLPCEGTGTLVGSPRHTVSEEGQPGCRRTREGGGSGGAHAVGDHGGTGERRGARRPVAPAGPGPDRLPVSDLRAAGGGDR